MAEEYSASAETSNEDQEVVTLGDVLQDEQQMMEDANAVLGAIDDKKCTYSEGYMKRQALYSCLTCIPEARTNLEKVAGVCLACCLHCHEGHELIELYTKRNFRCDCGNDKFPNLVCNLDNTKENINELNEYNQNFMGVYCICRRPYPDPEDPIPDEMIQCIICEDWYHTRHLGTMVPTQNYSEMTCQACISKHEFLLHYDELGIKAISEREGEMLDVVKTDGENPEMNIPNIKIKVEAAEMEVEAIPDTSDGHLVSMNGHNSSEPPVDEGSGSNSNEAVAVPQLCKMPQTKSLIHTTKFWAETEWRKSLCSCPKCMEMYEDEKVMFLLDPQDTVQVYEEKGKAKAREQEEKQQENDLKFLNSLNRVPLMEAIAGFNDLKSHLIEYLKKFAENKKVVREEDIKEFFSKYTKKKQKCEVPHYCR